MKIFLVTDKFPPEKTTVGNIVLNFGKEFERAGHDVCIITTTQNKKFEGLELLKQIKIFRIYSNYHERFRAYFSIFNIKTVYRFRKIIKSEKPDIIHFHNIHYYFSYYVLKVAKKSGAKVFLTSHDVMSFHYGKLTEFINSKDISCSKEFNYKVSVWQQIRRFRKRFNPLRNIIIRHYLRYVDKIFTVSDELKEALSQNGILNTETLHNGIDIDLWQIDPKHIEDFRKKLDLYNKKIILFGGRLSAEKGGRQAILALKEIIEKIPNTILLVLGVQNDYSQKMFKFAKELNIEKNIIFSGWLFGNELVSAYHISDLIVVPSICFDSFPTVILEAFACKKPVIATCFGGAREIVKDSENGYIINPFDINLFAEKLLGLLSDQSLAKNLGEKGFMLLKEKFVLNLKSKDLLEKYLLKDTILINKN